MKKIEINENSIGCGMCTSLDEEHFTFGDGKAEVLNNENLDSSNLQNAIESCPVGAISIVDDSNEK